MSSPLLLDTCAIVWMASSPGRFSAKAREAIEQAEFLLYSPISAWEIALKSSIGNLALPLPPREWFSRVVSHHGLERIPLTESILFRSVELPWLHRDPADRIVIATALERGLAVVTGDDRFPAYGVRTLV